MQGLEKCLCIGLVLFCCWEPWDYPVKTPGPAGPMTRPYVERAQLSQNSNNRPQRSASLAQTHRITNKWKTIAVFKILSFTVVCYPPVLMHAQGHAASPGLSPVLFHSPVSTACAHEPASLLSPVCFPLLGPTLTRSHSPTVCLWKFRYTNILFPYSISFLNSSSVSDWLSPPIIPHAKFSLKSCVGPSLPSLSFLPGQAHSDSWFEYTFPPNDFPAFIPSRDPFLEFQGSNPTQPKSVIKFLSKEYYMSQINGTAIMPIQKPKSSSLPLTALFSPPPLPVCFILPP